MTAAPSEVDLDTGTESAPSRRRPGWALPILGTATAIGLWWLLTDVVFVSRPLAAEFSPTRTVSGLVDLARGGVLLDGASSSVFRLLAGLLVALVIRIIGGVLLGQLAWLDRATRPVQLFGRMVSPLSWAPVAIIAFGIGAPRHRAHHGDRRVAHPCRHHRWRTPS